MGLPHCDRAANQLGDSSSTDWLCALKPTVFSLLALSLASHCSSGPGTGVGKLRLGGHMQPVRLSISGLPNLKK